MSKANLYTDTGEPKRIRCYMMKRNPTIDYITVVYTHANRLGYPAGTVLYRAMNDAPRSPQGYGQWGEAERNQFCPGGSIVPFSELPSECQVVVNQDYKDLWGGNAV